MLRCSTWRASCSAAAGAAGPAAAAVDYPSSSFFSSSSGDAHQPPLLAHHPYYCCCPTRPICDTHRPQRSAFPDLSSSAPHRPSSSLASGLRSGVGSFLP
uniref:Putative secreted protein n=1 Tax=Anopheles marajoara TaxID=58244 RepID=A0A2M4C926_9DIPT